MSVAIVQVSIGRPEASGSANVVIMNVRDSPSRWSSMSS
jgi:hypothetical protein